MLGFNGMRREERNGKRGRERIEETGNVKEGGGGRDGTGKNRVGGRERHGLRSVERLAGLVSQLPD